MFISSQLTCWFNKATWSSWHGLFASGGTIDCICTVLLAAAAANTPSKLFSWQSTCAWAATAICLKARCAIFFSNSNGFGYFISSFCLDFFTFLGFFGLSCPVLSWASWVLFQASLSWASQASLFGPLIFPKLPILFCPGFSFLGYLLSPLVRSFLLICPLFSSLLFLSSVALSSAAHSSAVLSSASVSI